MALRFLDFSTHRQKDENGFLIVKDNPIAKAGVFEYLMSEILPNSNENKVVKVYRPFDTLLNIKDSFANKPIKFDHEWVGKDGVPTADGAIGSNITADNGYLKADLIIYNPKLIEAIEKGLVELSPAYVGECKMQDGRFDGSDYQYVQEVGCINHLAVVNKGRSGYDLRILDTKQNLLERTKMAKKTFLDGLTKHINKFLDNEGAELEVNDSNDDLAKKLLEIAKSEVNDDEKLAKITELIGVKTIDEAEKVEDNDDKIEKDDEKVEIVDNEDETKTYDRDEDEDEKAKNFLDSLDKLLDKRFKAFADSQKSENLKIQDSYAEVSKVVGAFDFVGKSADEIYKLGFETLTNSELGKDIDAKSAFKTACAMQKPKFTDSKIETTTSESNILKMLNNF